jgi:hypothetical protein
LGSTALGKEAAKQDLLLCCNPCSIAADDLGYGVPWELFVKVISVGIFVEDYFQRILSSKREANTHIWASTNLSPLTMTVVVAIALLLIPSPSPSANPHHRPSSRLSASLSFRSGFWICPDVIKVENHPRKHGRLCASLV